jgi:hypothetical protein
MKEILNDLNLQNTQEIFFLKKIFFILQDIERGNVRKRFPLKFKTTNESI